MGISARTIGRWESSCGSSTAHTLSRNDEGARRRRLHAVARSPAEPAPHEGAWQGSSQAPAPPPPPTTTTPATTTT